MPTTTPFSPSGIETTTNPDSPASQQGYWGDHPSYQEKHNQQGVLERV
ncbi:hypothetical protein ABZ816_15915 [Actinosynnema sp. NPDC047251]|nr:hypothetical protein [Saccharothrix espanaensis]